jgi:SAM-dependent methyltransferase
VQHGIKIGVSSDCDRSSDQPAAVEHLLTRAEVLATETTMLLDLIGLEDGASVIDIGCGPLGILPLLRSRVGENGRVVGLDLDLAALATGERHAAELGLKVETVHADAIDTGLPTGSFDLVHERALLLNVTDPGAVVAEMARLARSGGVVALQEPDSSSWVCDPPHPLWELVRGEVLAVYPRTGRDFDIGRQTARLLRAAGLRNVNVRVTARVTAAGDYYQTFLLTLATRMRDEILAGTRLTSARLDGYLAELDAHLEQPGTLTCQPAMWNAWGTKP